MQEFDHIHKTRSENYGTCKKMIKTIILTLPKNLGFFFYIWNNSLDGSHICMKILLNKPEFQALVAKS